MNKLIAFVGFKSSGKNTAALPLQENGYTSFSFADALKDSLAAIFCWDRQMLEGITAESRAWREQVDEWWANKLGIPEFTPRWAMMNFGTQVMRHHFNDSIWIYNVERRIMKIDGPVVLTDCRFPNEIKMAYRLGGKVIRIKRGPEPEWFEIAERANLSNDHLEQSLLRNKLHDDGIHESEYAWIGMKLDGTIQNDSSVIELHERVIGTCLT